MPWPFRRGRTVRFTRYTTNTRTQQRTVANTFDLEQCALDLAPLNTAPGDDSIDRRPAVYGPYDADVRPDDEATIDGVDGVFQVDGEVIRHRNDLTGSTPCCEIKLRRRGGPR